MSAPDSASNSELCKQSMQLWTENKSPETLERFGVYSASYLAEDIEERHWFIENNKVIGTSALMIFAFSSRPAAEQLIAAMYEHLFRCQKCVAAFEGCVGDFSGMAEASGVDPVNIQEFQKILFQITQEKWSCRMKQLLVSNPTAERALYDLSTCFISYVYSHNMSTSPEFMNFQPYLPKLMQFLTDSGFAWAPGYLTCMILWPDTPISSQAKQLLQQEAPYDPKPMDTALMKCIFNYYKERYPPALQKTGKEWDLLWGIMATLFSHLSESPRTTEMASEALLMMKQCRQLDIGSTSAAVELAFKGGDIRTSTRQFCRSKLGSERGKHNQYITKMFRAIRSNTPDVYKFVLELLETSHGLNSIKVGAIAICSIDTISQEQTNNLLLANPEPVLAAMAYVPSQEPEKLGKALEAIMSEQDMAIIPTMLNAELSSELDIISFANKAALFRVIHPAVFSRFFAAFKGDDSAPIPLSTTDTAVKSIISRFSTCKPSVLTSLAKTSGFLSVFWLFSASTDDETAHLGTKVLSAINASQLDPQMTLTEMMVAVSSTMHKKAYPLCMESFIRAVESCVRLAISSNIPEYASEFWQQCWEFVFFLWNIEQVRACGFTNVGIKESLRLSIGLADVLVKSWPKLEDTFQSRDKAKEKVRSIVPVLSLGTQLLCLQRSSGILVNAYTVFVDSVALLNKYQLQLPMAVRQSLQALVTFERANQLTKDEAEKLGDIIGLNPVSSVPQQPRSPLPAVTPHTIKNSASGPPKTDLKSFFQTVPRQQAISAAQKQLPPPPPPKPKEGSKLAMIREELEARRQRAPEVPPRLPKDVVIHPARPSGFNKKEKSTSTPSASMATVHPTHNVQKLHEGDNSSDADSQSDDDSQGLIQLGRGKSRTASDRLGYLSMKKNLRPPQADERAQEAARMKARMLVNADSLHKSILLWDFYDKGLFPPELHGHNVKVPNKFGSVEEYVNTMRPLLLMEVWQQIQQQKEVMSDSRSSSFSLTLGTRTMVDDFVDLNVTMPYDTYQAIHLSDGDLILLFSVDVGDPSFKKSLGPGLPHCFGKVRENTVNIHYGQNTADFTVRTYKAEGFLKSLRPTHPIMSQKIVSLLTAEREYRALGGFEHCELRKEILAAEPSVASPLNPYVLDQLTQNMGLNKSQAEAAYQSLNSSGFKLIQGPPGTGKTKTILSIIGAYFSNPSNKRILVCAPSNAAVDELLLRMKAGTMNLQGQTVNLKAVRLGRPDSVSPSVVDLCLDRQIELTVTKKASTVDNTIRESLNELIAKRDAKFAEYESATGLQGDDHMAINKELDDLRREIGEKKKLLAAQREQLDLARRTKEAEYKRVQNELLSKAQVICCTLSGSASSILSSLELPFKTVIIDEAAQSVELSALIPFRYGCNQCIMVGDPHQLPPTVLNKAAAELDYEQSLFTRIFKQHQDRVSMLDEQFRMHPEIAVFPSNQFYKGLLKTGAGMKDKTLRPWHDNSMFSPYYFYSVIGASHKYSSRSLQNTQEAEAAANLVATLFKKYPQVNFENKIGIVTPYKQQMLYIRDLFKRKFGASIVDMVAVSTIDAFQGQEKDIIIFSTVRASPDSSTIGFVGDIRRMNVAITRARASLWILGSASTLGVNSEWGKLVQDARSRHMYCEARCDEFGPTLEGIQRRFKESPPEYSQVLSSTDMGNRDDIRDKGSQYRDRGRGGSWNNRGNGVSRNSRPKPYKKRRRDDNPHDSQQKRQFSPYHSGGRETESNGHNSSASRPDYRPRNSHHVPPAASAPPTDSSAPSQRNISASEKLKPADNAVVTANSEKGNLGAPIPGPNQASAYRKHASSGLFNVKKPRR